MTPTYSNNQIPSNPGFRGNKSLNIHWQMAGYFALYLHEIAPKYNSDQQHDHNFKDFQPASITGRVSESDTLSESLAQHSETPV